MLSSGPTYKFPEPVQGQGLNFPFIGCIDQACRDPKGVAISLYDRGHYSFKYDAGSPDLSFAECSPDPGPTTTVDTALCPRMPCSFLF